VFSCVEYRKAEPSQQLRVTESAEGRGAEGTICVGGDRQRVVEDTSNPLKAFPPWENRNIAEHHQHAQLDSKRCVNLLADGEIYLQMLNANLVSAKLIFGRWMPFPFFTPQVTTEAIHRT
jgi:hypothetical protein